MSYNFDIFISYRRNPETLAWINDHFVPLLSLRLEFELGRQVLSLAERLFHMIEYAPDFDPNWQKGKVGIYAGIERQ